MQIRVYTYSKSTMNKVVRHTVNANCIGGSLYIDENEGSSSREYFLYYPEIKSGASVGFNSASENALEAIKQYYVNANSPAGYLSMLDNIINANGWIGNREIALAMEIDAQKADVYKDYRQSYLDKQNTRHAEEAEKREAKRIEKERIAKEEKENAINAFVDTIKNGGTVNNANSILVEVCNRFYIDLPIKLKGWIYKSLYSITFKDGKAVSCERRGNPSTTIFTYLNQLCDRIAEETEEENATEEDSKLLQHLFGLDKNNA